MTRRVLVVADEPEVLGVCRTLCDPARYDVGIARTPEDGRARLEAGPTPDLMILDADLPDGGGIGFCREVTGRWPSVRIVLLARTERDRGGADWAGADAVLSKPIEPEALDRLLFQLSASHGQRAGMEGDTLAPL